MKARSILTVLLASSLGACGGDERAVADACTAEMGTRLAGKAYEFDAGKLQASAKAGSAAGTFELSVPVTFNRGLPSEFTQTMNCRARIDNGAASVIAMEFIWNMDELKKAE